ncbi:hypothetical protein C8J56DRAFT_1040195 [Mycena floridula]|nr:hypothetical protein C8J56DRAFT_1040195 [Mycena floridula]
MRIFTLLWFLAFGNVLIIDDNDRAIVYSPPDSWSFGPDCASCTSRPDKTHTHSNGWHDNSQFNDSLNAEIMSASLSFSGTAVSVVGLLDHFQNIPTNLAFFIDDKPVEPSFSLPNNSTGLFTAGTYKITIQNGPSGKSFVLLDYIETSDDSSSGFQSLSATNDISLTSPSATKPFIFTSTFANNSMATVTLIEPPRPTEIQNTSIAALPSLSASVASHPVGTSDKLSILTIFGIVLGSLVAAALAVYFTWHRKFKARSPKTTPFAGERSQPLREKSSRPRRGDQTPDSLQVHEGRPPSLAVENQILRQWDGQQGAAIGPPSYHGTASDVLLSRD